ncbi:MAG: TonB-dependent receptor [Bacteroidota bacterium]
MKLKATAVAVLLLITCSLSAQEKYLLQGKVFTVENLPVAGANIVTDDKTPGTTTDKNGSFTFGRIPKGYYRLIFSTLGFEKQSIAFHLSCDTTLSIRLRPGVVTLSEVEIINDYHEYRRSNDSRPVEVVNEQYIRMNMAGSLMQSLERLPGVNTISIGSGQSKPVIRGLSFNQVVVAENGIKHESQQWGADHGVEVDQFNVERIEVIKGPASLMYGSDAIAGVIDLKQSFLPEPGSLGGTIELKGQSNNNLGALSAGIHGRKDKLWIKARLTMIDYADYHVPADSIEYYSYYFRLKDQKLRNSAGKETNGSLALGWAGEKLNSTFFMNNTFSKSGFFANAHGLEIRNSTIDYDNDSRDIDLPYQQVNHLKLHSRTMFTAFRLNSQLDVAFQKNKRKEFSEAVEHGYMPRPADSLERIFDKETWSVNYSVKNHDSALISLSGGLNAEIQQNHSGGWGFILPSFSRTMAGIFLIGETRPTEKLLVLGGLRFDAGNLHIKQYTDWFQGPQDDQDTTPVYKERAHESDPTFSHLSWSTGLVYKNKGLILKANLGNSFRMPLAKELASDGVNYHMYRFERGNSGLKPEIAYQFDLGMEYSRSKWAFELSPFAGYFPTYIYLNPTYQYYEGLQVFNYIQSRVMRGGGELHVHYTVDRHLKAGAIGEYVWSRQLSGEKKGFGLPVSPPASLLLNLTYNPGDFHNFRELYVSADFKLVTAQNEIVPPEKKTPGYQVVNLSAGTSVKAGNQLIMLNILLSNLFNTRYLSHTSYYRLIGVPEPGRGLMIGMQIPFNFIKTKNHTK